MKIRQVHLKNVKSFRDTKVEFSDFLNVIRGKSDAGKSGFIKSLIFAIKNRAGRNIRTKGIDERSSVLIGDNSTTVTRIKDNKINGYEIRGNGISKDFAAIKTDVPFDVAKALNLSDSNIQIQSDTFFLIDESPGAVSKTLNEVSGLSEIDRTIKAITTAINTLTASVREANNNVDKDKNKISETKWAIDADKALEELESLEERIEDYEESIKKSNSLLDSYQFYKDKILNMLPSSITEDYKELQNLSTEYSTMYSEMDYLNKQVIVLGHHEKKYNSIDVIDLSDLIEIQSNIDHISTTITHSEQLLLMYRRSLEKISEVQKLLDVTLAKIKEIPTCPTCNRPLDQGK